MKCSFVHYLDLRATQRMPVCVEAGLQCKMRMQAETATSPLSVSTAFVVPVVFSPQEKGAACNECGAELRDS